MSNKVTLAAGAEATLSLHGFGFYVVKSDGPVIVELREIDGSQDEAGILEAGQGLQGSSRFEAVRIINMHTTTQTIEFYVGPRTFVDNRNVGVVQVSGTVSVDPVPEAANPAFQSYSGSAGVVGLFVHGQLWNPVGSGVDLFLSRFYVSPDQNIYFYAGRHGTQLIGNVANGSPLRDSGDVCKAYENDHSISSLVIPDFVGMILRSEANTAEWVEFEKPIKIKEGEGYLLSTGKSGAGNYCGFEWEERPNV